MKQISFDTNRFAKPTVAVRTRKEDLIEQIVQRTNEKDKRSLAKHIAVAANTLKWTETDLHALLKKADDPTIRSYTGFVKWSCGVRKKSL